VLAEPAIKTAPGRERAPERAATEPARVQLRDEAADVMRPQGVKAGGIG